MNKFFKVLTLALAAAVLCLSAAVLPAEKSTAVYALDYISDIENPATQPSAGDGSQQSPYQISNVSNIRWLNQQTIDGLTEGKYYVLAADLDFSGVTNFAPIGQSSDGTKNTAFKGNFDGKGFKISNILYTNPKLSTPDGFFGTLENAVISRLHLVNFNIYKTASNSSVKMYDYNIVGGIAGEMKGTSKLSYCTVESTFSTNSSGDTVYNGSFHGGTNVGGLVGVLKGGKIEYSRTNIYVVAKESAGGLVGGVEISGSNIEISNSYSIASVSRQSEGSGNFGGLAGKVKRSSESGYIIFTNCYFAGMLNAPVNSAGAISGSDIGSISTLKNCYYYNSAFGTGTNRSGYPNESQGKTVSLQGDEMRNPNSFKNYDFSKDWIIDTTKPLSGNAVFGKFPDFLTFYKSDDIVKVTAKQKLASGSPQNSAVCSISFDRYAVKGSDISLSFDFGTQGAYRLGKVTINDVDVTDKFYPEDADGNFVKVGDSFVVYDESAHAGLVRRKAVTSTSAMAQDAGIAELLNLQSNISIVFELVEKSSKVSISTNYPDSWKLVSINGLTQEEYIAQNGSFSLNAVPLNAVLSFSLTAPQNFKAKNLTYNIKGVVKPLSLDNGKFSITVTQDTALTFEWEQITVSIKISTYIENQFIKDAYGSVSVFINNKQTALDSNGRVSAYAGDILKIVAAPGSGFKFKNWEFSNGGAPISDTVYTQPLTADSADLTFRAVFVKVWSVQINNNCSGLGTLVINDENAAEGVSYIEVSHGVENTVRFILNNSADYEGLFAKNDNSLKVLNEGVFKVKEDGSVYNADINLKTNSLTILSQTKAGYNFIFEYSTDGGNSFITPSPTLDGNMVVNRPKHSQIIIRVTPSDSVFSNWRENDADGQVFEMTSRSDYKEKGIWLYSAFEYNFDADRTLCLEVAPEYFFMINSNSSKYAESYILSVNNVSVYSEDQLNEEGKPVTAYKKIGFTAGDTVTVKAYVTSGYKLDSASLNADKIIIDTENNVYTIVFNNLAAQSKSIKLLTSEIFYTVNVASEDNSKGIVSLVETKNFRKGDTVTVKATANAGYMFSGYVINDVRVEGDIDPKSYSFVIDGSVEIINIVGLFQKQESSVKRYTLGISQSQLSFMNESYQINGAGSYAEGSLVTVEFSSDSLRFTGWYLGDTLVSTDVKYSFILNTDTTLTPRADYITYTVTIVGNYADFITVSPASADGTYKKGTVITLSFSKTKLEDFDFVQWTNNSLRLVGGAASSSVCEVMVSSDMKIGAEIKQKDTNVPVQPETFSLLLSVNNGEYGSVSSSLGISLISGSSTILTATPKTGCEFLYWEIDGVKVTNQKHTIEKIQKNVSAMAYFQLIKRDIVYSTNDGGSYTGVTKADNGTKQTVEIKSDMGYRIDSVYVNGELITLTNNKTAIITLDNISGTQNVQINFKKTGLSLNDIVLFGGSAGAVIVFVAALLIVLMKRPNEKKVDKLLAAGIEVFGTDTAVEGFMSMSPKKRAKLDKMVQKYNKKLDNKDISASKKGTDVKGVKGGAAVATAQTNFSKTEKAGKAAKAEKVKKEKPQKVKKEKAVKQKPVKPAKK